MIEAQDEETCIREFLLPRTSRPAQGRVILYIYESITPRKRTIKMQTELRPCCFNLGYRMFSDDATQV